VVAELVGERIAMQDSELATENSVDQAQEWDITNYEAFFEHITDPREDILIEKYAGCSDQSDAYCFDTINPLLTLRSSHSSLAESVEPVVTAEDLYEHLNDRLVHLFFKNVHPLCPVMDEAAFYTRYRQPELAGMTPLNQLTMVELYAMMFAASLVT
jgi:hypothetical protein